MSDHTLSSLRRRARQTGSVEDDSALLVARLRAGTLTRERLELAAYCGDEAARAVLDWPKGVAAWCTTYGDPTFTAWLSGLSRWSGLYPRAPGWVLRRVALAAVEAWEERVGGRGRDAGAEIRRLDLHHPMWTDPSRLWDPSRLNMVRATVAEAASEIGEQPVREAICRSLVEWALSEDA